MLKFQQLLLKRCFYRSSCRRLQGCRSYCRGDADRLDLNGLLPFYLCLYPSRKGFVTPSGISPEPLGVIAIKLRILVSASSQAPAWEFSVGSSSFPSHEAGASSTGLPSWSLGTSVKSSSTWHRKRRNSRCRDQSILVRCMSCSGNCRSNSGAAAVSSSSLPCPQRTPTERRPLALAACTSTARSPIIADACPTEPSAMRPRS